eukprot:g1872.t1
MEGVRIKGGIYFDQIWTPEKSPYVLVGDAKIGKGVTLRMKPGTRVIGHGYKFTVAGILIASGSKDEHVDIQEVHFVAGKTDVGEIVMRRCSMSGGSIFSPKLFKGQKASVNVSDSTLYNLEPIYLFYPPRNMSITRNVFDMCGGISAGTDGVFISIRNNLFHAQTTDYAVKNWARYPYVLHQDESGDGKNHWYPMDMEVKLNTFACSDRVALRLDPGYNDAYLLAAQDNYFGTTDESVVRSMIVDKETNRAISSKIGYRPFLSARHPETPVRSDLECHS